MASEAPDPKNLSPKQLGDLAEHIKYEADMLAASSIWQHRFGHTKRQDGINMGLEASLFHLRNITTCMLYNSGQDNGVTAKAYLPDWLSRFDRPTGRGRRAASYARDRLRATVEPINEHLAHMTTARLVRHYEWDTPGSMDDVLTVLKFFRQELLTDSSDHAGAFEWVPGLTKDWAAFRPNAVRFNKRALCVRKDHPRPVEVDDHLGGDA